MVNLPPPDSDDQQPIGQPRDNDEAIAITIALLSVGAVLWWGWTRGESIFAPGVSLPQRSDLPSLVEDETLITVPGNDGMTDVTEDSQADGRGSLGFFSGFGFLGNGETTASDDDARLDQPAADAADEEAGADGDEQTEVDPARSDRTSGNAASAAPTTGTDTSAMDSEANDVDSAATNGAAGETAATSDPAPSETGGAEPAPLPELSISDVSEDYWAYPYIVSLFEAGLLPNFPSGTLQPDKELTRAELAALLNKSIVADAPPKRSLTFSDVPADYWAVNDIKQVVEAGYMTGFPGGIFQPNEIVPRYQLYITMATGLELSPPTDVDGTINQYQGTEALPAWAKSQVAAAASQGMVVNHPDPQQLAPQAPATRADLIATIHQALVVQGRIAPIETP